MCYGNNGLVALNAGQRARCASEDLGRAPATLVVHTQVPTENSHSGSAAAARRLMICEGASFAEWEEEGAHIHNPVFKICTLKGFGRYMFWEAMGKY